MKILELFCHNDEEFRFRFFFRKLLRLKDIMIYESSIFKRFPFSFNFNTKDSQFSQKYMYIKSMLSAMQITKKKKKKILSLKASFCNNSCLCKFANKLKLSRLLFNFLHEIISLNWKITIYFSVYIETESFLMYYVLLRRYGKEQICLLILKSENKCNFC